MGRGRGFYGIGIYQGKFACNWGGLLRSAYCFGAAYAFVVGRRFERQSSDTTSAWRHIPTFEYETFDQLAENLPYSCPLVGVELDERARPLDQFTHPERACYLLGAEEHGLPRRIMDRCHLVIQVPGPSECLNVAAAGSIVMYDRFTKGESLRHSFQELKGAV